MNQNDLIALALVTAVVGGVVVYSVSQSRAAAVPTPSPSSDPQLDAAQRSIAVALATLQSQGGGSQPQKDQMATQLEFLATQPGQSPAGAAALRNAAAELRAGQLPTPAPSSMTSAPPTSMPSTTTSVPPTPTVSPPVTTPPVTTAPTPPVDPALAALRASALTIQNAINARLNSNPGDIKGITLAPLDNVIGQMRAQGFTTDADRLLISSNYLHAQQGTPPLPNPNSGTLPAELAQQIAKALDPTAPTGDSKGAITPALVQGLLDRLMRSYNIEIIRDKVAALQKRLAELQPVSPPAAPSPSTAGIRQDLTARYHELRYHLADYLQGARAAIDHATLGAADRTAAELHRVGDAIRASELGALSTASYQRAGLKRPVVVAA